MTVIGLPPASASREPKRRCNSRRADRERVVLIAGREHHKIAGSDKDPELLRRFGWWRRRESNPHPKVATSEIYTFIPLT